MPTTPDYMGFVHEVMGTEEFPLKLSEVAWNIADHERLAYLAGNDEAQANPTIDAQLDKFIVASRGDVRLALFAAIAGMHSSLKIALAENDHLQQEVRRLKRAAQRKRR